jgi:hypothetical protein
METDFLRVRLLQISLSLEIWVLKFSRFLWRLLRLHSQPQSRHKCDNKSCVSNTDNQIWVPIGNYTTFPTL